MNAVDEAGTVLPWRARRAYGEQYNINGSIGRRRGARDHVYWKRVKARAERRRARLWPEAPACYRRYSGEDW